jgi:hypothetical protein
MSKVDTKHGVVESIADTDSIEDDSSASDAVPEVAHDVTRILVFITDAPPHGIGVAGDGFAQGEPVWQAKAGQLARYDPINEMKELCKLQITSHFVFAESGAYGQCLLTRSFYNVMASMSQGRAVRLGDATDLIELVSSCAVEARQMDDLAEELTSMMKELGKEMPELSKDEVKEAAFRSLTAKMPVVTQISCSELDDDSCLHFRSCKTLDEMRTKSSSMAVTRTSVRCTSMDEAIPDSIHPPHYRSLSATECAAAPGFRSLGCSVHEPIEHDEDGEEGVEDHFDENDTAVYRSLCGDGAIKRAMVIDGVTRAPPPIPAMRVRSYDANMTNDQLQRLLARVS